MTAEAEGNTSKARRYGRICKQFEDAIKLRARGKPVPLDELPVPPGFPPLTNAQGNGNGNGKTAAPKPEPSKNAAAAMPVQPKAPVPPPRAGKE